MTSPVCNQNDGKPTQEVGYADLSMNSIFAPDCRDGIPASGIASCHAVGPALAVASKFLHPRPRTATARPNKIKTLLGDFSRSFAANCFLLWWLHCCPHSLTVNCRKDKDGDGLKSINAAVAKLAQKAAHMALEPNTITVNGV